MGPPNPDRQDTTRIAEAEQPRKRRKLSGANVFYREFMKSEGTVCYALSGLFPCVFWYANKSNSDAMHDVLLYSTVLCFLVPVLVHCRIQKRAIPWEKNEAFSKAWNMLSEERKNAYKAAALAEETAPPKEKKSELVSRAFGKLQ